jgi:hypothetical protein
MYELKLVPFNQTEYLDRFLGSVETGRLSGGGKLKLRRCGA